MRRQKPTEGKVSKLAKRVIFIEPFEDFFLLRIYFDLCVFKNIL